MTALPLEPSRPVTDAEIAAFRRDGVVHLPGIIPLAWIEALVEPVDAVGRGGELADLGAMAPGADPDAPAFRAGTDHWRHDPTFAAFALRSPLGPIVAALLGSEHVWLWEDSVLVKEPGSPHATRFHTDAGYFPLTGDQLATTWLPLDPATPESGVLHWVRGSHRDPVDYRPNLFVTDEPIPGTEGEVVPDVAADPELSARLVSFDVVPGDLTVHHHRTLHGAPPNRHADRRRRAVSVRYVGDDARYHPKPGLLARPNLDGLAAGAAISEPWCPLAFPRRPGSPG